VHGGRQFVAPTLIDTAALAAIEGLVPLAPLHQPHNVMGIRTVGRLRPALPQVACFDTAFHRTQPEARRRLPLPEGFFAAGIERYGFHGISYQSCVVGMRRLRGKLPPRMLVLHLGSGASACAILNGRSCETSMGFSALDGLMMGTRPGSLDAGVVLHMLAGGMGHAELTQLLYTRSGLLGVSGLSSDMRTLLASDAAAAKRAVDMFCHRAAAVGAALAVSLDGLDAIVFTGGIGQNAARIRADIAARLGFVGVAVDCARNEGGNGRISPDAAAVEAWVVPADEERIIAEATLELTGRC
jgi:acetate kinase